MQHFRGKLLGAANLIKLINKDIPKKITSHFYILYTPVIIITKNIYFGFIN